MNGAADPRLLTGDPSPRWHSTQRALWQRPMAHAYDVMRGEQHRTGEVNEDWPNPIGRRDLESRPDPGLENLT